jgi:hypothetical protein
LNHPQIAVASVVANSGKWKIKATYVVKEALETYYRLKALRSGSFLNAKAK